MRRQLIANILILALSVMTFSGCGYYKNEETPIEEAEEVDLSEPYYDSSEQVAYEKPTATVHILIDRNGYATADQKKVVFVGEDLADTFTVYNKDTKEAVYSGTIQKRGFDRKRNATVWEGDFSSISEAGEYYIATQKLGQSYPFVIADDTYEKRCEELLSNVCKTTISGQDDLYFDECLAVSNMLLCYEMNEIEDSKTEAYFKPLLRYADKLCEKSEPTSMQASIYSGVLAQFSYCYRKVDANKAGQYLQCARTFFNQVDKEVSPAAYFAATQLYKATGEKKYEASLQGYINGESQNVSGNEIANETLVLLGDIAYLTTSYKVDQKVCEHLMDQLLKGAEALSANATTNHYRITCSSEKMDEIYMQMIVLAVVDYAIVSHEYLTLLKEDVHYLYGKGCEQELSEQTYLQQTYLYFITQHIAKRKENIS